MDDAAWLSRAIRLADRGWGHVHPNPLVGAVIVRDGTVVGEGWHRAWGGPHAEIEALRAAGDGARGATLYVSLEPCAHTGKTPPCTNAIAAAGIARVVFGADDTCAKAAGGAETMRRAGIRVDGPLASDTVRRQNRAFFHVQETASTFVALKLAMSLDARISARRDAPTQLTGSEAVAEVHRLRAGYEAILVGRGTAAADDPLLTVRGAVSPRVPPARIVLDTQARLGPGLRMLADSHGAPVWIIVSEAAPQPRVDALARAGAKVIRVQDTADGVDLREAFSRLREHGINTILCEGGGILAASLLASALVQRVHLFIAPVLLGSNAVPAFAGDSMPSQFRVVETGTLGHDAMIILDRSG